MNPNDSMNSYQSCSYLYLNLLEIVFAPWWPPRNRLTLCVVAGKWLVLRGSESDSSALYWCLFQFGVYNEISSLVLGGTAGDTYRTGGLVVKLLPYLGGKIFSRITNGAWIIWKPSDEITELARDPHHDLFFLQFFHFLERDEMVWKRMFEVVRLWWVLKVMGVDDGRWLGENVFVYFASRSCPAV